MDLSVVDATDNHESTAIWESVWEPTRDTTYSAIGFPMQRALAKVTQVTVDDVTSEATFEAVEMCLRRRVWDE